MRRGDYAAAEAIVRRRIVTAYYDFDAHYLLADGMAQQKKYTEAAAVMKDVLAQAARCAGKQSVRDGIQ